jgi:NAD(P)-dependent dehydrogenase (short-subunit alcohol dehydrogenase family)
MRLQDKVIIVTGSSQGIGEAIARRFVAEGANVVIHGLEPDLVRRVFDDLQPNAALVVNDLSEVDSAQQLVDTALAYFGKIDGIVNNAGTTRRATLEQTDPATFDFIINTNLRAPLLLIQAAMPHLLKSRGAVLNVGSLNAYCGASNLLPYSISKGGLMTLTRNLADANCKTGVRFNQVNLGWVLTENEKRLMEAGGHPPDWWRHPAPEGAPTGALMLPEQVAAAAVYWMGDESIPVTGSVLELNQFPVIGRNTVKEKD